MILAALVAGLAAASTGASAAAPPARAAAVIREVEISGATAIPASELRRGSLLRPGTFLGDSLLSGELARIDSIYFAHGRPGTSVTADTAAAAGGVRVLIAVNEAEVARISALAISGLPPDEAAPASRGLREGDPFDPAAMEEALSGLLARCVEIGYPYAQVWLTGFSYESSNNTVSLSVSVFTGERSLIGRIVFEGLAKTDSSIALRTSRLSSGRTYRERDVASAREYLAASGYFETVGEARLERRAGGRVDVRIPVRDRARTNIFQGAFGISRDGEGDYLLNGSIELDLRNIAGSGRNARIATLNDGRRYSRIELKLHEPFVLSSPVALDAELTQIVQDSTYIWHAGGLYARIPLGPASAVTGGLGADRNVPGSGELDRSVRQRFRIGISAERNAARGELHVEGARKESYYTDGRTEGEWQFLYRFSGETSIPAFAGQSLYLRLVSDAVFAKGEIPLAETYSLGGARSLRGYRENQFRGERIAFTNIEYRFGESGGLFVFDDAGIFYHADEGWTFKNGVGFGLHSVSPVGVLTLSFGVGERLSLDETRVHVSLLERF
jgi:outer membrane protein assembly factor BamA